MADHTVTMSIENSDIASKLIVYRMSNEDAGNRNWNHLIYTLTSDFAVAYIQKIVVNTVNSATVPGYLDGESVKVGLKRGNVQMQGNAYSDNVHQWSGDNGTAITDRAWVVKRPFDLYVYPGDILGMDCPPADDSGSPTGDYQVWLTLTVIEY
jgi:hypothetical protein